YDSGTYNVHANSVSGTVLGAVSGSSFNIWGNSTNLAFHNAVPAVNMPSGGTTGSGIFFSNSNNGTLDIDESQTVNGTQDTNDTLIESTSLRDPQITSGVNGSIRVIDTRTSATHTYTGVTTLLAGVKTLKIITNNIAATGTRAGGGDGTE